MNKNNTLLNKIYNFEYYNWGNVEFIKQAYKEFLPAFEEVSEELRNQKQYMNRLFKFEYVHTPLFRAFFIYFIESTIIIFYKRIKNPPKLYNEIEKKK